MKRTHQSALKKKKAALHNNSSNNTFSEEFHFFSFNTLHGMISPYIVKQSLLLPRLTPQMVTPSYPTAKNNIGRSLLATMYS